jgi:hypothetical protein
MLMVSVSALARNGSNEIKTENIIPVLRIDLKNEM